MSHKYTPRRTSKRWLDGAPPYVLDVLDNKGKTADRYTVLFTFPLAYAYSDRRHVELLPPDQRGDFGNTFVPCLGMSGDPTSPQGVSTWADLTAFEAARYRYRYKRHRIRWADLPPHIQAHVRARAEDWI